MELEKVYQYLQEANDQEDQDEDQDDQNEENELEKVLPERADASPEPVIEQPLQDERNVPIADGQIPQDSSGMVQGDFNALDPSGSLQATFEQGNYNELFQLPQIITAKVQSVSQTLVPLIEVALIELLGSTSMYKRAMANTAISFENNQCSIAFTFVYQVSLWIGLDIDYEDIKADSDYVYNKLKPLEQSGVKFTACTIDTKEGTCLVSGMI